MQDKSVDSDLNAIFEKIRVAVFKNGVRTTEFFRDHDKLRSGIITENQVQLSFIYSIWRLLSVYKSMNVTIDFFMPCLQPSNTFIFF